MVVPTCSSKTRNIEVDTTELADSFIPIIVTL